MTLWNNATNDRCQRIDKTTPEAWDAGIAVNLCSITWMLQQGSMPVHATVAAAVQGWVMTEKQVRLWVDDGAHAGIANNQGINQPLVAEHIACMALTLASADNARCTVQNFVVDEGVA